MKKIKTTVLVSCLLSNLACGATLSEALSSSYQNNPDLISAREQLKSVDEKMFQAISGFLPSINYVGRKDHRRDDTISASSPTGTIVSKANPWENTRTTSSRVTLEQNIFNGGKTVMAVQIAKYIIDSARAKLLSKEQEVFAKTIEAFYGVIYTKKILEITKEDVLAYEKRYDMIKERVLAGIDKQSDLAKVAAERANAYTNLTSASGEYESALATYFKEVGVEADNLASENLGSLPANQVDLLQKALKGNPQLTSAVYDQKAAEINVLSNAASLLPKVDIGGEVSKTFSKGNYTNAQPYTKGEAVFIQVSVPIYNRGIEYSLTREAKAKAAAEKYNLKNTRATVTRDASKYWNDYITKQESIKSAEEAVKSGMIALEGAQQSYDEGVQSLTDLLNAQTELYHYKIRLAQVQTAAETSRYSVLSLFGGLNAKNLALPTKIYNPAVNYNKVKMELIGFSN